MWIHLNLHSQLQKVIDYIRILAFPKKSLCICACIACIKLFSFQNCFTFENYLMSKNLYWLYLLNLILSFNVNIDIFLTLLYIFWNPMKCFCLLRIGISALYPLCENVTHHVASRKLHLYSWAKDSEKANNFLAFWKYFSHSLFKMSQDRTSMINNVLKNKTRWFPGWLYKFTFSLSVCKSSCLIFNRVLNPFCTF